MTGFLLAGVVPGVVTADENQAGITALIVVGSVQQICVEEESGSGFHFAIHVIEVFSGKGNALGVGAGLCTEGTVFDAAKFVGAAHDLKAAVDREYHRKSQMI